MLKFQPFKNDHQSMQIGELIFENQTDKVIVYGDIDITATKKGLAQALKLQQIFNDVATALTELDAAGKLASLKEDTFQGSNITDADETIGNTDKKEQDSTNNDCEVDNPFS